MEAAVQELLRDFFQEAKLGAGTTDIDLPVQRLVEGGQSDSAVCKRDLRRLLEKDPAGFLQSASHTLKVSADTPGVAPLLEVLWSSSLLLTSLTDPALLSLPAATALARRWVTFDCMLDIKLLQIGFPLGEDDAIAATDMARSKRALEIVAGLPPNRHVLLSLARLLRHPDAHIRSKAALLYARASRNPDWVRKMLAEPDARVRANAVEGLWEAKSPLAAALFREAALDPDHRVAANALIGLHYCSEPEAVMADVLESMVHNNNPLARKAAAFAVGRIMGANRTAILEGLLRDGDPAVRGEALRSLIRIRRQDRTEAPPEAETVAPAVEGIQETPPSENAATPEVDAPAPAT